MVLAKTVTTVAVLLAALIGSARVAAQDYVFLITSEEVERGETVFGEPEETLTLSFDVQIDSTDPSIFAWSIGVSGSPREITFGLDPCDDICMRDRLFPEAPRNAVFFTTQKVLDPDYAPTEGPLDGIEQGPGVMHQTFLKFLDGSFFLSTGLTTVFQIDVHVTVPTDPQGVEVNLTFQDGLSDPGFGVPVTNLVVLEGNTEISLDDGLTTEGFSFTVKRRTPPFRRGDSNADGEVDIADPISLLRAKFLDVGAVLSCEDASDTNDDGEVDVQDAIFTLDWIFLGESVPLPPGPWTCGSDPNEDALAECNYALCAE